MQHLDDPQLLHRCINTVVQWSIVSVGVNGKRASREQLMAQLARTHGPFQYRNFHREALNRAYGIAFTCAAKLNYAKARGL